MHRVLRNRLPALPMALTLGCCAVMQLRGGPDATPAAVREVLLTLFGHDAETAARLVIAAEVSAAVVLIVVAGRVLSVAISVATAFVSLASISGGLRDGVAAIAPAAFVLLASVGSIALLIRATAPSRVPTPEATNRRGMSAAWTALAAIAVATATARFAAGMEFQPKLDEAAPKSTANAIDLDLKPFVGTPVSESPIGTYLPQVVARIGLEDAYIVFYNPHCDACHTLFETAFATPRRELVFAIEIPPPPGAVIAAHDELGPIECPTCEFDSLAPGPLWLLAPPTTVKVERGIITCVADRFGGDCVGSN